MPSIRHKVGVSFEDGRIAVRVCLSGHRDTGATSGGADR